MLKKECACDLSTFTKNIFRLCLKNEAYLNTFEKEVSFNKIKTFFRDKRDASKVTFLMESDISFSFNKILKIVHGNIARAANNRTNEDWFQVPYVQAPLQERRHSDTGLTEHYTAFLITNTLILVEVCVEN